jgi:hypothetical protein
MFLVFKGATSQTLRIFLSQPFQLPHPFTNYFGLLQPPSSADVTESGSLNLPEPSGPHRAVMGMIYLLVLSNRI